MNDRQDFAQGLNTFALTLYQKLLDTEESSAKNLLVCPFSVAHTLAFLWNCADEKTGEELAKVLGFKGKLSKEVVAKLFSDYHEDVLECVEQRMAHKVFVNGGPAKVKVSEDAHAKAALKKFSVDAESLNECLKLRDLIETTVNKWMAEVVDGQSVDLMNNSVINLAEQDNDSTRPWLLLDFLQFQPTWATEFASDNTTDERFWINESESVPVQMMHMRETCRYGYMLELESAVLELELDFDDFSMLFLVPDSRTGLAEVLRKLQATNVMYLAAQLRRQDTLVYVPKFKLDVTFALSQELLAKFVSEADDAASPLRQSADHLSGLFTSTSGAGEAATATEGDALLLHKATLVVGEQGAEKDKQKIDEEKIPEKFLLDRPFVFMLKHKCNIVLIGHVMNPENP